MTRLEAYAYYGGLGDPRYQALIRQIGGRFPQTETAEETALLQKRAAQRS